MSFVDGIKKVLSEISARHKYVHGDKGKLEDLHKQLKQWRPDGIIGETGRIAGLGSVDILWGLWCLLKFSVKDTKTIGNKIFLDNAMIDKLQENKKNIQSDDNDSKFKKFFKNLQKSNPRTAARLHLWMVYALTGLLFAGGVKVAENKDQIKENVKEWWKGKDNDEEQEENVDEEVDEAVNEEVQHNFAGYKQKLQPVTPWLIAQLISAEGVRIDSTGMHVPYRDSKGIWTIGFGSTCLKDGTKVTKNTPPITTEEAYELARWHIEDFETYFILYCYSVMDDSLTVRNTGEAFGLSSIVYNSASKFIENENDSNHKNRFTLLRKEYEKYGVALPDSIVAKAFEKYPIRDKMSFGNAWIDSHKPEDMAKAIGLYMKDGAGMHWRRWLEAGLITGDIKPESLLECPIKGMYDFYMYMGGYKEYTPKPGESKAEIERKNMLLKKTSLWENTPEGWVPKAGTYDVFKEWLKDPKTRQKKTGKIGNVTRPKVKEFLPEEVLTNCMNGKCEIGGVVPKITKKTKEIEEKTYVIGYEDLYRTAMKYYDLHSYRIALSILEGLAVNNPNNALLHNDMALIYNKIGKYDKAIEHARKVIFEIGDKSQYGAAQYNAGVAYEKKGDLEKALQNYRLAVSNGNVEANTAKERVEKKLKEQKSKKTAFVAGSNKVKYKQNNYLNVSKNNDYTA